MITEKNLLNVKSFFDEKSVKNNGFFNHDGSHNKSVDGTGETSSVNPNNNSILFSYVKQKINKEDPLVLDFGTGVGYMVQNSEKVYGFEGSKNLISKMICDTSRVCITDFTVPIEDSRLKNAFDITTSFEVIEHIPRNFQNNFWKNVSFVSKYHLCSIHIMNQESDTHITITSKERWKEYFNKTGIIAEDLHEEFPYKVWQCSAFFLLKMENFSPISDEQTAEILKH